MTARINRELNCPVQMEVKLHPMQAKEAIHFLLYLSEA